MDDKKILKLLHSDNPEDQILGATLAGTIKGREWCRRNMTEILFNVDMTEKGTRIKSDQNTVLYFDDFTIWLGPCYVEWLQYPRHHLDPRVFERFPGPFKEINYKNDTIKQIP